MDGNSEGATEFGGGEAVAAVAVSAAEALGEGNRGGGGF